MSQATPTTAMTLLVADPSARRQPIGDWSLRTASAGSALLVIAGLAVLLIVLIVGAWLSIRTHGFSFLISRDWRPNALQVPARDANGKTILDDGEVVMQTIPPAFGALPVIYGTAVSSGLALVFAVPLSLGAALFLVRAAPRRLRSPISFMIEFLAAIPSIAYGIWAIFVLAPLLQRHVEPLLVRLFSALPMLRFMTHQTIHVGDAVFTRELSLTGRDLLGGSLVLAVMIVPIITAIARDVLRQVPRAQIEGAVALGATWWESSREMLHFSRSGLLGAVMLGLARAAGETMAVTMIIGNNFQIVPSPLAPAQTMSSLLANEFAEASTALHTSALCEVALILLIMSLVFNMTARYLVVGSGPRPAASA